MWVSRNEMRRLLTLVKAAQERSTTLEAELREERERSRHREDQLVDRVMTASGRYGLTPEAKKIVKPEPKPPAPLNALEEARLIALREAAVAAGRNPKEADQLFEAQRNGQPYMVGRPDEPYILPT